MNNRVRHIVRREVDPALMRSYPDDADGLLARVFAARGVGYDETDLSLRSLLPVSSLENTDEAAERLALAHERNERVVVVGDFDADGATATAVVIHCLRAFGFDRPEFVVPDRQKFGYGLSEPVVDIAAKYRPGVIITVDNGISSHGGIEHAAALGIDVIVTDHHLPAATDPDARVIVNPNGRNSGFASKALAGVGVAFYVMAALGQRLAADDVLDAEAARRIVAETLDFVAIGTVADLVPLDRNNRVLVGQGLRRIRGAGIRPGIAALFAVAGRNPADACASDLGFAVGPRLNAAGRLTDMTVGIQCLLADNPAAAGRYARELNRLNEERKALQAEMQRTAEVDVQAQIEKLGEAPAYCLASPDWHAGVVGLVATRIKDVVNRPVFAFAPAEEAGMLKGSGRSVNGVHLRDLLVDVDSAHPGLIDRYGGHAMAAGLSLLESNLDAFRRAMLDAAARRIHAIDEYESLWSDGVLEPAQLNLPLAEQLRHAGPWGQGFPEPCFDGEFHLLEQREVGVGHLKMRVAAAGAPGALDAIAFNTPELPASTENVRLLYRLDVNEFRGRRTAQLVVEYVECV